MERVPARVLLVEDDQVVRSVVDRQLRSLGCDVIPVSTGRDAIRLVELGTRVDLLLTDLDLPDIDGASVARAVSAAVPAVRVVFMSGRFPSRPLEPRAAPFLLKPFSQAQLARALAGQPR
jgi:two-component system cell cycle sensor histidine kinase/response regulator CckA